MFDQPAADGPVQPVAQRAGIAPLNPALDLRRDVGQYPVVFALVDFVNREAGLPHHLFFIGEMPACVFAQFGECVVYGVV